METHTKGCIAEQKVILRAIEKGYTVSKPISQCRYDLIIDDGKTLSRVQVKYGDGQVGAESEGSVSVRLTTWNHAIDYERSRSKTYNADEIDMILAYIAKVDKIVKIPPDKFAGKQSIAIRIDPPKNNIKSCNMLKDLEW
jgi:hypothetical protein